MVNKVRNGKKRKRNGRQQQLMLQNKNNLKQVDAFPHFFSNNNDFVSKNNANETIFAH